MEIVPIEMKSGQKVTSDYFKGSLSWNKMTHTQGGYVIYAGDTAQHRSNGIRVIPFRQITKDLF